MFNGLMATVHFRYNECPNARSGGGRTNRSSDSRISSRAQSQAESRPCTSFGDFPKIETIGRKSPDNAKSNEIGLAVSRRGTDSHLLDGHDRTRPVTSLGAREVKRSGIDSGTGTAQIESRKHRLDSEHQPQHANPSENEVNQQWNIETPNSVSSWASSVLESKVVDFQKSFRE